MRFTPEQLVCHTGKGCDGAVEEVHEETEASGDGPVINKAEANNQSKMQRQIITDPWAFKRSLEMWPSPM